MRTPGRCWPYPARPIVAAFLFAAGIFLVSCSDAGGDGGGSSRLGPTVVRADPRGDPRTLRLGFSTLPPERTSDAYVGAFATAAQYADVVLIQRNPPWEDFLPNGSVSGSTTDNTRLETELLDQYDGLKRFYAIDPTDGVVQRHRIVNLPASVDPEIGFDDERLRQAFRAYTAYVIANYKPDYLALGVEINMLYERNRAQFDAFVSLYNETYADAKKARPEMKVFPTFQLEDLEGLYGAVHPPHWEVLDAFAGRMDALAISTYPFLGEWRAASDIREDYYSQLRERFPGEIIISESGYASEPIEGRVNVGTEEDQQAFLGRLLGDAEKSGASLVVWFAALDPSFANEGATSVFRSIGLRKSDGSNKLGWSTWEEWSRRPLR